MVVYVCCLIARRAGLRSRNFFPFLRLARRQSLSFRARTILREDSRRLIACRNTRRSLRGYFVTT